MKLSKKVKLLLASDISGYRIAKDTGISISSVVKLKSGQASVSDMRLKNAEKLGEYWDKVNSKKVKGVNDYEKK